MRGRGGWSWYTGSLAWLYRAAVETLLGLAVQPGQMSLSPRLPAHWTKVELRLHLQGHDITVHWQRELAQGAPIKADQQLALGRMGRAGHPARACRAAGTRPGGTGKAAFFAIN